MDNNHSFKGHHNLTTTMDNTTASKDTTTLTSSMNTFNGHHNFVNNTPTRNHNTFNDNTASMVTTTNFDNITPTTTPQRSLDENAFCNFYSRRGIGLFDNITKMKKVKVAETIIKC